MLQREQDAPRGGARQAAADNPPFTLDYWRLNMSGRGPKA